MTLNTQVILFSPLCWIMLPVCSQRHLELEKSVPKRGGDSGSPDQLTAPEHL